MVNDTRIPVQTESLSAHRSCNYFNTTHCGNKKAQHAAFALCYAYVAMPA